MVTGKTHRSPFCRYRGTRHNIPGWANDRMVAWVNVLPPPTTTKDQEFQKNGGNSRIVGDCAPAMTNGARNLRALTHQNMNQCRASGNAVEAPQIEFRRWLSRSRRALHQVHPQELWDLVSETYRDYWKIQLTFGIHLNRTGSLNQGSVGGILGTQPRCHHCRHPMNFLEHF